MQRNFIRKFTLRGFQNFNRELDLAPITVISGNPDSGKTSVLAGLHWLIAGYIPGVSKKTGELFEDCASGPEMYAAGELANGEVWERKSLLSGGAVKTGAVKNKQKIEGSFLPTVALDSREYLSLSDRERVKMIFNFVDLSQVGLDVNSITARLKGIKVVKPTADSEAAIAAVAAEVAKSWDKRGDATIQEWLSSLIPTLKESATNKRAGVRQMEATIQGDAVSAQANPVSPTIERDLSKARTEQQRITGEIASLRQRVEQATRANARKSELETFLKGAKPVDHAAKIAELNKNAEALRAIVTAYKSNTMNAGGEHARLCSELDSAERRLKETIAEQEEITATFAALAKKDCCPTCRAKDADLGKRVDKLKAEALKPVAEQIDTLNKKILTLGEEIKVAAKAKQLAEQSDKENAKKRDLSFQYASEAETLQREQTTYEKFEAELKGIGDVEDAAKLNTELATLENSLNEVAGKVRQLDGEQRQAIANRAAAAQREKNKETLARYEAELEVVKLAQDEIETALNELIDKTIAPLVTRANAFAGKILKSPLVYHNGVFGMWNGANLVKHHRLAGTYRAVTYAALSLALVPESPLRILWIDEMGIMPPAYRAKVLDTARELIEAGKLDQMICIDWNAAEYKKGGSLAFAPEGFKLIEL